MENKMLSVNSIAEKCGVSTRRIVRLCNLGEIEGAIKLRGLWKIPYDAIKPNCIRNKEEMVNNLTSNLLPCPIGITSYKEVSTKCYYIDKTLLIKNIIDDHNKVVLFTRPRRFGKSLTMDMIKTFF